MFNRILVSLVVGVATALVCMLLGAVLVAAGSPVGLIVTIGEFLKNFSGVIGLLTGIWYFLTRSRTNHF